MSLTTEQRATLKAAILADAAAAALWNAGDMYSLAQYCNASTTTNAWRENVPPDQMVEQVRFVSYGDLPAGKRDAFRLMLDYPPIDATRAKVRKGIEDIFAVAGSYTDSAQMGQMLGACVEKATWAELALGFTTPSAVGGVTAIKRNVTGALSVDDVSALQGV